MSKPVFYTFGGSVWAAAPELAILELGYEPDAIDKRVVNLMEGENFKPSFIAINPNATLPTVTVGDKMYGSTVEVIDYLISNAPKVPPSAPPKTVGGKNVVTRVHEDDIDPNFALLLARNEEELKALTSTPILGFATGRQKSLEKHSVLPEAEPYADFYKAKLAANGGLTAVYTGTAPPEAKEGFFKQSTQHWVNLKTFFVSELPQYLPESGFICGERPGKEDFHVGAWIARIVATKGGSDISAVEKELGQPVPAKVKSYWDNWSKRDSWKTVYAGGLH